MSDVAEVKEALEKVIPAKSWPGFDRPTVLVGEAAEVIVDRARRWVRMVEGLDYEAAAKALYNAQPEVKSWTWPRWENLRSGARAFWLERAHLIVDAAVGVEKEMR